MKKFYTLFFLIIPFFCFSQQKKCNVLEDVSCTVGALKINSAGSDFGPSIVRNELWFSAFSEKNIKKINQGSKKDIYYDLFSTAINSDGTSGPEVKVQNDLSEGFHEGPVAYCEKTGELFVTLSNSINPEVKTAWIRQEVNTRLRIVIARFENGKWTLKEEMPFNNPMYSVGHPSVTPSGDTLYFTSDIPDFGFGGTDIYLSVRENGKWGSPVNLGSTINTSKNEMFPFYYPDGTLIFASNGIENGKGGLDLYFSCLTGKGFSSPRNLGLLNTESDDFGLVLQKNGQTGYFTSNRPGFKGDDDIFIVTLKKVFYDLSGIVLNETTNAIIQGAAVVLSDCSGNQIAETRSASDGRFWFRAPVGQCLKIKASSQNCDEVVLDVGQQNFIEIKLKCGCNLELALLDIETLSSVSGSLRFCDGRVVKSGPNGLLQMLIPCDYDCLVAAEAEGYLKTSRQIAVKSKSSGSVIRDTVFLYKAQINKTFNLENIYYDFDKWDILPESEVELNKLVKIMVDNPNLKVELGSHTDSRGTDSYNKWLSRKRSDAAVGYIINNGIAKERIAAKGYGESKLINRCKNGVKCPDAEHRQNRRTEFKILAL